MTTIRPLIAAEWRELRDLRLAALGDAPGEFVETQDDAQARSEENWRRMIAGPRRHVFAAIESGRLVGCAGVFSLGADLSVKSAHMRMLYIVPEFRKRGLANLLCVARLAWLRNRAQFERVVSSHRASNDIARHIALRHGFMPRTKNPRLWPDGGFEDELYYEQELLT